MSKYIFGPVASRRLGRSLGVDLVPFKTCTYDCIYCQLGPTTCKTLERTEWAPLEDVLAELAGALDSNPDYVTLGGSGEPTLHCRIGELIRRVKAMTDIPVAVLTNGSLLCRRDVRADLAAADLVVPSLDAGGEETFRAVNRPHEDIAFDEMLRGLIDFRRQYEGQYWLEILLLAGQTAAEEEVSRIVECVERIKPDRVQLNTATRPPAEGFARAVPAERLRELAAMFDPPAEVIADVRSGGEHHAPPTGRDEIMSLLRRRPSSLDDIAGGLGIHRNEAVKHIEHLLAEGLIEPAPSAGRLYYKAADEG